MKRIIVVILSLLLIACGDDEDNQASKLQQNIAILCNQESGFLTIFDLNSEVKIDSVDLHIELQHYKDAGHTVDDFYINSPRPHFVMTSHDGRYVYVVMTSNNGAVVKLDANFHVINFLQITETNFPAHAQITSDDQTIFISAWTTNGGGSSPDDKNMILRLNSDFTDRLNYRTPAGAHGIKLTKDEKRIIVGHDLADYVNDIDRDSLNREFPLVSATAITISADQNGGNLTAIHSPTQVGITPDDKFAFFSCKKSSQILIYDLIAKDTLGFIDLQSVYGVQNAGPYSIEVGPKTNYSSSANKYAYINFKEGSGLARLKIDNNATSFEQMFTASASDFILLNNGDARPHGLDITDDATKAVVSSEFSNSNNQESHLFFIDLENWQLSKTIRTKIQSRGVTIYPGEGN